MCLFHWPHLFLNPFFMLFSVVLHYAAMF
uniref:Uncharacterized protein n=1 Tax=Anguilla anguilla TaxID=7936 RepID=A0A0E9TBP6_ANGAN